MRDRRPPHPGASAGATSRLAADLGASLADTRTAWAAATLRGDAALQSGDREAVAEAFDEQRALLRALHTQVDTAIGRAAVEREAEGVVERLAGPAHPAPEPAGRVRRRGVAALAGTVAAAVIGLVGLAPETVPPVPDVAPLASEQTTSEVAVASERVEPFGSAFERVTDALADLGAALARGAGADASRPAGPREAEPEAGTSRPHGRPEPARQDEPADPSEPEIASDDGPAEGEGLRRLDDLLGDPDAGAVLGSDPDREDDEARHGDGEPGLDARTGFEDVPADGEALERLAEALHLR